MENNAIKQRKISALLKKYHESKEATVITGFRRVGKTTILKDIYQSIRSENKLFLDLETPVNQRLFLPDNYEDIKLTLQGLGVDFEKKSFFFFDEIQFVKNMPSIVKYFYDHYKCKFYLTGSSSFYLKNHFTESLSGRKYLFNLYPLDFEEFLWFKDVHYDLRSLSGLSNQDIYYDLLSGLYHEYLEFGGFPQVVLEKNNVEKKRRLNDIIAAYFQFDVQSLAHFKENENLKKLLFLLPSRVGSKFDIGKLANAMNVTRTTVQNYIDFFEQTFLISVIKPFSRSRDVEIRNKPKIYFLDTGIVNILGQFSLGNIFENKICNQLIMREAYTENENSVFDPVQYYATKQGQEIDFIYNEHTAYEVKQRANVHDLMVLEKRAKVLKIPHYKVLSLEKCQKHPHLIYPFFLHTK